MSNLLDGLDETKVRELAKIASQVEKNPEAAQELLKESGIAEIEIKEGEESVRITQQVQASAPAAQIHAASPVAAVPAEPPRSGAREAAAEDASKAIEGHTVNAGRRTRSCGRTGTGAHEGRPYGVACALFWKNTFSIHATSARPALTTASRAMPTVP